MSVLINGVEIPKEGDSVTITIYSDGSTWILRNDGSITAGKKAKEIPHYCRIVDMNRLKQYAFDTPRVDNGQMIEVVKFDRVYEASTAIEAST